MTAYLRLNEADGVKRAVWEAAATGIFWQTANAKTFASEGEKEAFLKRWFGNYAYSEPESFLLAIENGEAIGYLAGCLNSFAPSAHKIAGDIGYFTPEFSAALRAYPSHFHINVRPDCQSRGTGRALTARFHALCMEAGSPGIHIVTGASSPARQFYTACGFELFTPFAGFTPTLAVMVKRLP